MHNKLVIGIIGIDFNSGNLGCQALGYAFYDNLEKFSDRTIECVFLQNETGEEEIEAYGNISFRFEKCASDKYSLIKKTRSFVDECDVIVDFTYGDSFSDIYGVKRLIRFCLEKIIVIRKKKRLILAPQTYGPYNKKISKKIAKYILEKADAVAARDDISAEVVEAVTGRKVDILTDMAFLLPYEVKEKSDKKKAGINISGLLWNGGYNENNQFGLMTDYRKYIMKTIDYLKQKGYEIHLISHVTTKDPDNIENDWSAINEIVEKDTDIVFAKSFKNPIEAKTYIAQMDIFLGARMHATIAGVSTNVATIPFSYSKKFEGLFGSIKYPYIIRAMDMNTEEAVEQTQNYIDHVEDIKNGLFETQKVIEQKTEEMTGWFKEELRKC